MKNLYMLSQRYVFLVEVIIRYWLSPISLHLDMSVKRMRETENGTFFLAVVISGINLIKVETEF